MRNVMFALELRTLMEAFEFAKIMAQTQMVPEADQGKPGNILAKMQTGAELGIPVMQAIRHLYCVDGRVSMEVPLMLALVEASGLLDDKQIAYNEAKTSCTVTLTRKGRRPHTVTFGEAEARKAGLMDKKGGMYSKWDWRMYYNRAMGFALQDEFQDVLRGVVSIDYLRDAGYTIDAKPVQAVPEEPKALPAASLSMQAEMMQLFNELGTKASQRLVRVNQNRGREAALIEELRTEVAAKAKPKAEESHGPAMAKLPEPTAEQLAAAVERPAEPSKHAKPLLEAAQ